MTEMSNNQIRGMALMMLAMFVVGVLFGIIAIKNGQDANTYELDDSADHCQWVGNSTTGEPMLAAECSVDGIRFHLYEDGTWGVR